MFFVSLAFANVHKRNFAGRLYVPPNDLHVTLTRSEYMRYSLLTRIFYLHTHYVIYNFFSLAMTRDVRIT